MKLDLVKQAQSQQSNRKKKTTWFERLDEETKESLYELRTSYHAGELRTTDGIKWGARAIVEQLLLPNGIDIGVTHSMFNSWLQQKQETPSE